MKYERWRAEHIRLFNTDLTNEEISVKVGRPISAVRRTRYRYKGHFSDPGTQVENRYERLSKVASECRILDMCKKLNVKLGKETV